VQNYSAFDKKKRGASMFGDEVGTCIVLKVGKVAFDSKTKSEISFVSIGVFAVFYVKTNFFPKRQSS